MAKLQSFRFGVIGEHMQSAQKWITKAQQAEQLGYSTLLIRDHFIQEPYGTISDEITELMPTTIAQKVEWIRQAAEERFHELELNMVIRPIFTEEQQGAEQLIQKRGWSGLSTQQVLEMPSMFIGTPAQIMERMQQRREQYDFSYYVVSDADMEAFAPIVSNLTSR